MMSSTTHLHPVMLQLHRKRKTLVKKDIEYVRRIKGELLDA